MSFRFSAVCARQVARKVRPPREHTRIARDGATAHTRRTRTVYPNGRTAIATGVARTEIENLIVTEFGGETSYQKKLEDSAPIVRGLISDQTRLTNSHNVKLNELKEDLVKVEQKAVGANREEERGGR